MKRTRRPGPPVRMPSGFTGFRFPPEVILVAVRWYLRYGLSYRDLEELLAERGIEVDHVTLYRWVQRFTPLLIDAARPGRHPGRGTLVRRRDLRQGLRRLVLRVSGGRPAGPGERRVRLTAQRHRLRADVLHRRPGDETRPTGEECPFCVMGGPAARLIPELDAPASRFGRFWEGPNHDRRPARTTAQPLPNLQRRRSPGAP
jgi:transposase, IS6 family